MPQQGLGLGPRPGLKPGAGVSKHHKLSALTGMGQGWESETNDSTSLKWWQPGSLFGLFSMLGSLVAKKVV